MSVMKKKRRQDSIYFYTDHPDNFSSVMQMFYDGNVGFIYSLNGEKFMRNINKHIDEIFTDGVEYVMFSMLEPTLKLLKRALSKKFEIKVLFPFKDEEGREFNMLLMTRIK